MALRYAVRDQAVRLMSNWGWIFFAGVVYAALGIFAFSQPEVWSIGVAFALGAVLCVGGIVQLIQAFQLRGSDGSGSRFLNAVLAIVSGGIILRYPDVGMTAIMVLLSVYFFMGAAVKWSMANELRPHHGWGWLFVSALISALAGATLILTYPVSAALAPAMLLGVELIAFGICLMAFALTARRAYREVGKPRPGVPEEARERRAA